MVAFGHMISITVNVEILSRIDSDILTITVIEMMQYFCFYVRQANHFIVRKIINVHNAISNLV